MSLLQDVLRTQTLDHLDKTLASTHIDDQSEDELVDVVSLPGTPSRSRAGSRPSSRPTSRAASPRRAARSLLQVSTPGKPATDPLKAFPTEISQRIFGMLSIKDLARCARVSRKWSKSQTLNYVWFMQFRKDNFHDDTLPPGKWTKRESKQSWRITYLKTVAERERSPTSYSRPLTPLSSGHQTPREAREEKWKAESEGQVKPSKVEMREMYKELGGRKARGKGKVGMETSTRDKGGWTEDFDDF
ncbi:F-box protein [Phanerochaete sordida]|uniref:F-box protein n=1 Tax=Phanerochaete sordida TaxID=48140 RepID=A0A9P3LDZ2_9APHY|nr:F-box protein [Phanerochaete sordida]